MSTSKAIDGYPVKGEFVIKLIISSVTGKDLEGFGDNFEQEVIYQRNRRFYVEEVEERDGIATIVMQEVPYGQESTEPETNTGRSDLASVQQMQAPDSKEGGLPGVSEGNSGRNPVQSGGSQETVSGGSRDSFRGEGLSDPTPRRERTEWQLYLDEYDRETARASAAPQRTKWQAYLDEYDRLWAELMELASREPEQQDTVWKRYLREYDEAQRREEALKTVEILGYVPEEYAELFGVEPGTSWLVVRTYEQRRKLRAQRQNAERELWDPERPAVDGSADFSDREAFERTQPVRMEDDAPENAEARDYGGIPKSWEWLGEVSHDKVLKGTNPKYRTIPPYLNGTNDDYMHNCTNCVVAYSQRSKGYAVIAKSVGECGALRRGLKLFTAWEGREPVNAKGSGLEDIAAYMDKADEGTQVAITVSLPKSIFSDNPGHAFLAEKRGGKVEFLDPQRGTRYNNPTIVFDLVNRGGTYYMRIDDLSLTDRGVNACKGG